jgi:hypothetical protein
VGERRERGFFFGRGSLVIAIKTVSETWCLVDGRSTTKALRAWQFQASHGFAEEAVSAHRVDGRRSWVRAIVADGEHDYRGKP